MKRFLPFILCLVLFTGLGCAKNDTTHTKTDDAHMATEEVPEKISPYTIHFESTTEGLPTNKSERIIFSLLTKDNRVVKDFDIVHEKMMHVILVRKDLHTFEHIHPTFDTILGQFSFEYTFPSEGEYRMFADFSPRGSAPSVASGVLLVGIGTGDYQALKPHKDLTEQVGPYMVEYTLPANRIVAEEEFQYGLKVSEKGKPVLTFEPYLGAAGHSIIIKEGTLDYLHTHAINTSELTFMTTFPHPGTYAVFTQFQIKGKLHTAKRIIKVGDKNNLDLGDIKFDFLEVK